MKIILNIITLFLLTSTVLAQDNPNWANDYTIVVTASRIPQTNQNLEEYPAAVAILTQEDVAQKSTTNIAEILSNVSGITSTDTTGFGTGSGLGPIINFRGVGGGDKISTVTRLNGVKINQLVDNAVLWKALPTNDIARIEVLKGGSAATTYGEGTLSGAINILTKDPSEEFTTALLKTYGSFGEDTSSLTLSDTHGDFSYLASFGYEEWDGYRSHSDYLGKRAALDLRYQINDDTSLRSYTLYYNDNTEFPGSLSQSDVIVDPKQKKDFWSWRIFY